LLAASAAARADAALVTFQVDGDAIAAPLTAQPGDAARGRQIAIGRDSNCTLCHAVPREDGVMGNLAPPLEGVGARLAAAQLRLRIVDSQRLNPDTIMPSYYRIEGLARVAEPYRGKPVLTAQQVEDLVAYLGTLR
jgi:sulfur-oxidizing protein SoxX